MQIKKSSYSLKIKIHFSSLEMFHMISSAKYRDVKRCTPKPNKNLTGIFPLVRDRYAYVAYTIPSSPSISLPDSCQRPYCCHPLFRLQSRSDLQTNDTRTYTTTPVQGRFAFKAWYYIRITLNVFLDTKLIEKMWLYNFTLTMNI